MSCSQGLKQFPESFHVSLYDIEVLKIAEVFYSFIYTLALVAFSSEKIPHMYNI